jgi:AAA family ATP:ADP antiporter
LSVFTDVRAGEGTTAVLMLLNIFLLLICYSVIKTVREPLILLGGGAEVRSYAAAGQALLLMAFVPAYGWFSSRVNRAKLLVGVTLFFIVCIELFAVAVAARLPYVGVAFFVWVGIFNMSLVAQFWSFASDIYTKDAGDRLFPIIMIGMTAGAPLGSFTAGHLFRMGVSPQVILQVSAALLATSVLVYVLIDGREAHRGAAPDSTLAAGGGFALVLNNGYLRLVALLVVLLNIVNTTGEYLVARLLTAHVKELAMADPTFDKQAFIGAFSGDYQFWVNVTALVLQAFVASRLVKRSGLRGALLALPFVALGGYAIIAAGVGFSIVRWIKTAENATDYSIMNTARQLLWLPTTREEKYKAKQAIDTFFVRSGDVLSAAVVFLGTSVLHLTVNQFAAGNIALTLAWVGVAVLILKPRVSMPRVALRPIAGAALAVLLLASTSPIAAQSSREEDLAARRAEKARELRPFEPKPLERRLASIDRVLSTRRTIYPFFGTTFEGSGFALGPGLRARYADTGTFDAHAAWSIRNYKAVEATLGLPALAARRVKIVANGGWQDAPNVAFHGVGAGSSRDRGGFSYSSRSIGVSARVQAARLVAVGGAVDAIAMDARSAGAGLDLAASQADYRRSTAFAELDWRTSPSYSRKGGFYRVDWSDYRQTNDGALSFRQVDAQVQQFIPLLRENWVIALRGMVSSTDTNAGQAVPFFLLPDLGGSHALRGYPGWRFRDRNRVLFTGEYRWTAGPLVDMAIFFDAGQVAPRLADVDFARLQTSHGIGISLHTPSATLTRVEVARSVEGTRLLLAFSPSF